MTTSKESQKHRKTGNNNRNAEQLLSSNKGENRELLAEELNRLGMDYIINRHNRHNHDPHKALKCFTQALEILTTLPKRQNDENVAETLYNIAVAYIKLGQQEPNNKQKKFFYTQGLYYAEKALDMEVALHPTGYDRDVIRRLLLAEDASKNTEQSSKEARYHELVLKVVSREWNNVGERVKEIRNRELANTKNVDKLLEQDQQSKNHVNNLLQESPTKRQRTPS